MTGIRDLKKARVAMVGVGEMRAGGWEGEEGAAVRAGYGDLKSAKREGRGRGPG